MPTFDWFSDLRPAIAAQQVWNDGAYDQTAIFHWVYRPDGPFAIACGGGLLAEHVRSFRFTPDRIQRLGQFHNAEGKSLFSESFLNHLQRLKLRVRVDTPPEGMLLLPGEPLLVARGPMLQILLLESAFRHLIGQSSHWATLAAHARWAAQDFVEEDTPVSPRIPMDTPEAWRQRGLYIGGSETYGTDTPAEHPWLVGEGLIRVDQNDPPPFVQVRRLYNSRDVLADVRLDEKEEARASVSKTTACFAELDGEARHTLKFTRFQNVYQPALVKGHPVTANTRLSYFRQRALKQMESFRQAPLADYPCGWYREA